MGKHVSQKERNRISSGVGNTGNNYVDFDGVDNEKYDTITDDGRMKKVPFAIRGFRENVAYTTDPNNLAREVVTGWINSPGHRKNMEADSTLCSIAVFEHNGYYYFT